MFDDRLEALAGLRDDGEALLWRAQVSAQTSGDPGSDSTGSVRVALDESACTSANWWWRSMPRRPCSRFQNRAAASFREIATKRAVLSHVRRVLRPGGFLVLGGAESTLSLDTAFQRMELDKAVVFQHLGGPV